VVAHNGQVPVSDNAAFVQALGGAYIPTGRDLTAYGFPGGTIAATPGVADSAFSTCEAMQGLAGAFGYEYLDGVPADLEGNELIQSPEFTASLGAQYTHYFGNGMSLSGRVDYYWQDEFYASTFNREQDLVDAWDVWNAQVTLYGRNDRWHAQAFIQNLENDDELVGTYQTDASSGLYSNGFLIEPRLYGLTIGVSL
jgi:outer membrane receptor protein involved in Fe transport